MPKHGAARMVHKTGWVVISRVWPLWVTLGQTCVKPFARKVYTCSSSSNQSNVSAGIDDDLCAVVVLGSQNFKLAV